jgi:hypothetical protein
MVTTIKIGDRLDAYYGSGYVRDADNNIIYKGGLPLFAPSDINNKKFLGNMNPDFIFGINNKFVHKTSALVFSLMVELVERYGMRFIKTV